MFGGGGGGGGEGSKTVDGLHVDFSISGAYSNSRPLELERSGELIHLSTRVTGRDGRWACDTSEAPPTFWSHKI